MLGKRELENKIDDRIVKNVRYPKPSQIVVNTIIAEFCGTFELWMKIRKESFLLATGLEDDIRRKHQMVQNCIGDTRLWPYMKGPQEIVAFASKIASQ